MFLINILSTLKKSSSSQLLYEPSMTAVHSRSTNDTTQGFNTNRPSVHAHWTTVTTRLSPDRYCLRLASLRSPPQPVLYRYINRILQVVWLIRRQTPSSSGKTLNMGFPWLLENNNIGLEPDLWCRPTFHRFTVSLGIVAVDREILITLTS